MIINRKIDCLFIHVPDERSRKYYANMVMAMGLFALAEWIERKKYTARIIHLGIEKMIDPGFSIIQYLKNKNVKLIAVSLHWAQQSSSCIKMINEIKSSYPGIKIVLGGFTASYFAKEIMKRFKSVDYIIRGEAEIPLAIMLKQLSRRDISESAVPNMVWRNDEKIVCNKLTYVAREKDINELNFTNFSLMDNFQYYKNIGGRGVWGLSEKATGKINNAPFPLCIGRGCAVNCSFCGGSKMSQKIINNRRSIVYRKPEKVMESINEALAAGYRSFFICFDPHNSRGYYRKLFYLIRKSKLKIQMGFGCWRLPTKEFIDAFKNSFKDGSYLEISPESGSERLRKLNKGYYYSNKRLIDILKYLKKINLPSNVYFAHPLPFSTSKDIWITDKFIAMLKIISGGVHDIIVHKLSFDPGSPMFVNPKRYNIIARYKKFIDYVKGRKRPAYHLIKPYNLRANRIIHKWNKAEKVLVVLLPIMGSYLDHGKYARVIEYANKAIKLDPDNYYIYILMGESFKRLGKIRLAVKAFKKANKLMGQ